ncbi:MFS transporter [Rubellimicrobium sp. CFH 75288]|uniref:MFS transporter n=1 Tax=Rubellimicrobium sp. CFH 75288 TaxID=2697034 RepID=UPI00210F49DE|nr:MFS transporter [Rubellimicrobium sp. CFH 75288]
MAFAPGRIAGDGAAARRRIWGWMFFDLAQQPYATLGLTFVFGPYFAAVASGLFQAEGADPAEAGARAQSLWGLAQGIAGTAIALSAPFLGAWADASGRRMPWILALSVPYVLCAWSLWFLLPDGTNLLPVLALFWVGFVAGESALNVNNAQLPSLAPRSEIGRVSGSGAALGYWGGVVSLVAVLLFLAEGEGGRTLLGLEPAFGLLDGALREGTRAVGPFIAIWFVVALIPFVLWVRDPPPEARRDLRPRSVLRDLGRTVRDAWERRSLRWFLLGSMLYRDGLGALYSFGGVYATVVLGWDVILIGIFGLVAAVAAAAITWAGGLADRRWGPKPVLTAACWALILVCLVLVGMGREAAFGLPLPPGSRLPDAVFFVCGALIGGAGGALYAASRTMMVRHSREAEAGRAFGLFALTGRATAFLAPLLVAGATAVTGSAQSGLVPVIVLFLGGLWLLRFVKPDGDRAPCPAAASPFS